jgi:hypothetical protein
MAIPFSNENLTLAQMRNFVGELSDLDIGFDENDDISTDLVNGFIKEGFQKIVALSQRYPYYQASYLIYTVANQRSYTSFSRQNPTPITNVGISTIQQIISVVNNTDQGNALVYIDQARAESIWVGTQDIAEIPAYFSIWGNQLNLWPKPDDVYTLTVRGYRKPYLTWFSDENEAIDIDPQMQLPLINYVMARIFQFQEDPEMSNEYMRSFEKAVAIIQGQLTAPSSNRQLIMSGGLQLTPYDWWWSDTPNLRVLPGSPYPLGVAL